MASVRRNKTGLGGHKSSSWPGADSSGGNLVHAGEKMSVRHHVKGGIHHHAKMRHSAPGQIK